MQRPKHSIPRKPWICNILMKVQTKMEYLPSQTKNVTWLNGHLLLCVLVCWSLLTEKWANNDQNQWQAINSRNEKCTQSQKNSHRAKNVYCSFIIWDSRKTFRQRQMFVQNISQWIWHAHSKARRMHSINVFFCAVYSLKWITPITFHSQCSHNCLIFIGFDVHAFAYFATFRDAANCK